MPFQPSPPVPSNIIKLDEVKRMENPIEGLFPYFCPNLREHRHVSTSTFIRASSSDRYNYVVNGAFSNSAAESHTIFVWDMFLGVRKELYPKNSGDVSKIWTCIYLSSNRGFLVYETPSKCKQASIISVDFENGTYEFTDSVCKFSFDWIFLCYAFPSLDDFFILINTGGGERRGFHIFKFDSLSFEIKSHQTMAVPKNAILFNLIDRKLIFTEIIRNNLTEIVFGNFKFIEDDNSFVEIENTAVTANFQRALAIKKHIQYNWYGNKAFVFVNVIYRKIINHISYPHFDSPILLVFEIETKIWSEIRVNLPSNRVYYQFHVDNDAMLSVVPYSEIDEKFDRTLPLCTALIRIPLKKPDKLMNLCWFRARECGLSNEFTHLIF